MKLAIGSILLLACAISGAVSCAPGAADTPDVNGRRYFGSLAAPAGQLLRFNLGSEPELRDPGVMSGQPDGRFARLVFEGLTTADPRTLEPRPGQAYRWQVSEDGLVYTFHLRRGLAWADGTPLGARDFVYSWRRVLDPATASRNASLLYAIRGAEDFNKGVSADDSRLGLAAPDDSTFVVTLATPTAYFLFLTNYYTFVPVPRHVVEAWGPRWTLPEHLVGNGAFRWTYWRQNDRYEFVRSPGYWDHANVRLDRIVAYTVDDLNTSTNLYESGAIDWNPSNYIPSQYLPFMKGYADFRTGRYQATYFYSVNVTRPPLDNVWVRRALDLAIDRVAISRDLLKGSREPWGRITPEGYPGYVGPRQVTYDPARARDCLARAGYPGGRGFPRLSILFNTSEDHRRIAEAIQAMWKRDLGIHVELANQEWGSYMQATTTLHYDIARRSWIGDYLDPNSFLQLLVSGDGNNRAGFSDPRYDALVRRAAGTLDPARRFATLAEAESLVLDQAVYLPIYHYSTSELVKPWVRGIYQTALDVHPLTHVWIDHDWRQHEPLAGRAAPR
ncbi:MAG TPA: peptide ABC transporter substrate-binding protein [Candidatus Eisenbacteria bacterium]